MSHRLALTLALVLTIAFAGLLIVERDRLFAAPIADEPASLVTPPPAAPRRADPPLPANGQIVDAAGPDGIARPAGAPIDLVQPAVVAADPAVSATGDGEAASEAAPREQRRHDRGNDHGDDHDAEHAGGGGDD
ncbi:MAG TPA: hypothetical protein VFQ80_12650 [Thermomicrobiales bacterium]|jgi:hypothetical protein|nr:hypothetical protein [Thermomicrobiales bacterium]